MHYYVKIEENSDVKNSSCHEVFSEEYNSLVMITSTLNFST